VLWFGAPRSPFNEGNRAKTATAPLVAILAADNEFHEELPSLFRRFPQAKDVFFAERAAREQAAALNASFPRGPRLACDQVLTTV
jgi:3-hydroxypropanoate dehydrogenase